MTWQIVTNLGRDSRSDLIVEARCHCGTRRYIRAVTIANGQSQSCGCVRAVKTRATQFKPKSQQRRYPW